MLPNFILTVESSSHEYLSAGTLLENLVSQIQELNPMLCHIRPERRYICIYVFQKRSPATSSQYRKDGVPVRQSPSSGLRKLELFVLVQVPGMNGLNARGLLGKGLLAYGTPLVFGSFIPGICTSASLPTACLGSAPNIQVDDCSF